MEVKDLMCTKDVTVLIPGTNPNNKYDVKFLNGKGFVGVKRDGKFGSDSETRVRCILKDVQDGKKTGGDYSFLLERGWEKKPNNHHVSIHISATGAARDKAIVERLDQAIAFLASTCTN